MDEVYHGKVCTKCGIHKPYADYYKNKNYTGGYIQHCKACHLLLGRKWAKENRQKKYRLAMARTLSSRYGITTDQYEAMHAAQGGLCAICQRPEDRVIKGQLSRLSVDHCHSTGRVRGLLCSRCNLLIGRIEDDAELLERAAAYVWSF